ncbi:uncharacterized protein LOC108156306 [Drosophila miranda]|uniref:uncharacterized protein LOC108156306 n=1 Tax=Drosophila miranda TaxID=7229 RepID=UPI0007E74583|nr:uncharacterized protein LOC108156306 [Drosophila miranda]
MCRCPASWSNSQKPRNIAVHATKARRLLFSTDVGSHQAIIRARVDGNERVELEGGVTVLALDQQLYHAYRSYKHQWEEQKNLCFHAYPACEQHYRLGGICVLLLDDKTGLERITGNGERRSVELQRLSQFTDIWVVWTPDAVTQYSRRLLVPQASDATGGQGELRRLSGQIILSGGSSDMNNDCISASWRCDERTARRISSADSQPRAATML